MTKLVYLVLVSFLAVGCAAEQAESDGSGPAYRSVLKLDLLEGDLPEPLESAYALESDERELDLDTMRALYDFGVTHRTDARPWLLLAHDAMRSETYGFAVSYYRMAIKADPRAAQQRGLLGDVLRVVRVCSGATEQAEASDLVTSSYGREAAEALNEAMLLAIAELDTDGAERLRALLEQLDVRSPAVAGAAPSCFGKACSEVAPQEE